MPGRVDPFASVRSDQRHRTGRKRIHPLMHDYTVHMTMDLLEWYRDRAALLSVPLGALMRDVMTKWRELVLAAEDEEQISFGDDRTLRPVPDRYPGYAAAIHPSGVERSHTDSAPLGIGEL